MIQIMKKPIALVCLLVLAAVLPGCGTPGFPRQSCNPKQQIKQLEDVFNKTDLIKEYYAPNVPEAVKKDLRNTMIDSRLALINLNYNQFIAQFSVTKESLDFGTEVTQLGLNLATTVVGGSEAKTILAAVASGVTGSKLALDKNFFFEKSVPVLITSMNAQRKVTLLPIIAGASKNTGDYSLAQALSDLDAYYFSGTFIGALQAIQADAGNKEMEANKELKALNKVRRSSFVEDDAGNLLENYWRPLKSGTLTVTSNSTQVVGTGTHFTTELATNFLLLVEADVAHVKTITDDTHLTTEEDFTESHSAASYEAIDPEHQQAIEDWLETNQMPDIAIEALVKGDLFSPARKKAVTDLKIKKP